MNMLSLQCTGDRRPFLPSESPGPRHGLAASVTHCLRSRMDFLSVLHRLAEDVCFCIRTHAPAFFTRCPEGQDRNDIPAFPFDALRSVPGARRELKLPHALIWMIAGLGCSSLKLGGRRTWLLHLRIRADRRGRGTVVMRHGTMCEGRWFWPFRFAAICASSSSSTQ